LTEGPGAWRRGLSFGISAGVSRPRPFGPERGPAWAPRAESKSGGVEHLAPCQSVPSNRRKIVRHRTDDGESVPRPPSSPLGCSKKLRARGPLPAALRRAHSPGTGRFEKPFVTPLDLVRLVLRTRCPLSSVCPHRLSGRLPGPVLTLRASPGASKERAPE
jgi:hypothetical protein